MMTHSNRFTSRRSFHLVSAVAALAMLVGTGCDDKPSTDAASSADGKEAKKGGETKPAKAKPKQNRVASCQRKKTDGYCSQFGEDNIEAGGMDHIKTMCEGLGEFSEKACPTEKSIGSCTTPEGMKVFYSDGPLQLKAADAEKQCKEGIPAGKWKAS